MTTSEVIVRWGLGELSGLLHELGVERPFLIASERWSQLSLPAAGRWRVVPTDQIAEVAEAARGCDGLLVVGGGSAIDVAKAVSVATRLRIVSVPTTYSGAECTRSFGIKGPGRIAKGGGYDALVAAIVYETALTLHLPPSETGGTALNALAHCAEALYAAGRNPSGDRYALAGARSIGACLPLVLSDGHDPVARKGLLEGAMLGGLALEAAGSGLAHAMAQAVGGKYGISHGALNALCLPVALRFNSVVTGAEIERFAEALEVSDAPERCETLARLAGHRRLRDLGVPSQDLPSLAELAAMRPGAVANPRPASPAQILELLRRIW